MKLKKALVIMTAVAMSVASMSTFVAATTLGYIDTTLTISALNLDVDTEYMADKDTVTRALQLTADEADLIPDSQRTSVTVDGTAVYSDGTVSLDGTAAATILGTDYTFDRVRDYEVTSLSMTMSINNTNYPAVYDSATKTIKCDYTISSTQTSITAKVVSFTINAVNAGGQEAVFTYAATDTNTTCTITIGNELAYSFTRPGILTVEGEATATVGDESVDVAVTNSDGNGKLNIDYTVSVTPVDPQGSVADFVDRLYSVVFDRPADSSGKAYWINRITNGTTGGDVARYFLCSKEFENKGVSDSEFVNTLYYVFFDRAGETSGVNYWMNRLSNGTTRTSIISSFINSTEFANICLSYGINSGSTTQATIVVNPTEGVVNFVNRLYINCLGRDRIDQAGANYWTSRLANRKDTGSKLARMFFNSAEFTNQGISDSEFLTRLYNTVMGRTPDSTGFNYYLTRLQNGTFTRNQVLNIALNSTEWNNICVSYGILK